MGVVVRGDGVVAQLTNDRPPYEVETAYCDRERDGWVAGSSGNSTSGFLPTGPGVGTSVVWDEPPAGVAAARFEYQGREQVVPVEHGCVLAVFDNVTEEDGYSGVRYLAAWVDSARERTGVPRHEPPAWMRERISRYLEER